MNAIKELIEKLENPIERSVYNVGEMYVTIDATPGQIREAAAELRDFIEAAREYMQVVDAIGANSDNAVRQSYIDLKWKLSELDGQK